MEFLLIWIALMLLFRRRKPPRVILRPGQLVLHGYIIERHGGGEPMPQQVPQQPVEAATPAVVHTGNVVPFRPRKAA